MKRVVCQEVYAPVYGILKLIFEMNEIKKAPP